MTKKSITFTPEMLRAILEGNKTQTRRPVKPQPIPKQWITRDSSPAVIEENGHYYASNEEDTSSHDSPYELMKCPYGKPGDRLQVKYGPVVEVTEIRVERVQDISIHDSLAEGIRCPDCGYTSVDAGAHMDHAVCVNKWLKESKVKDVGDHSVIGAFRSIWDSIYHKKPDVNWDANPYVWVVSFKVVNP